MREHAQTSAYSKDHPFSAKLIETRLLNKPGSHKETRHLVVEVAGSDLHCKGGDSRGVFPANRKSEVDEFWCASARALTKRCPDEVETGRADSITRSADKSFGAR